MLLQLFQQSKQQVLVSWLRSWLPQLLSDGPAELAAVAELAIQRIHARTAATSSSGSSGDSWQQAADLVCRLPSGMRATDPFQFEMIFGPESEYLMNCSKPEGHRRQQCAAHMFFRFALSCICLDSLVKGGQCLLAEHDRYIIKH
jgi:hypothetical protein